MYYGYTEDVNRLKIDDDDVKVAKSTCLLITIFNVALEYSVWFVFQNFGSLGEEMLHYLKVG